MGRLFGTDGIRGVANEYPLTVEGSYQVGRAVASFFHRPSRPSKILIGKDTRQSGTMIETALADGICSVGADAHLAGILPTPAVASLVSAAGAAAGIVISASHNPYTDNGVKLFDTQGYKLSDVQEDEIERLIRAESRVDPTGKNRHISRGKVRQISDASERYLVFLKKNLMDIKMDL